MWIRILDKFPNMDQTNSKYWATLCKSEGKLTIDKLFAYKLQNVPLVKWHEAAYVSVRFNLEIGNLLTHESTKFVVFRALNWNGANCVEIIVDTKYMNNKKIKVVSQKRYGFISKADKPELIVGTRQYDPENLSQWIYEERVEFDDPNANYPVFKVIDNYVADKTANYEPWLQCHFEKNRSNSFPRRYRSGNFSFPITSYPNPLSFRNSLMMANLTLMLSGRNTLKASLYAQHQNRFPI